MTITLSRVLKGMRRLVHTVHGLHQNFGVVSVADAWSVLSSQHDACQVHLKKKMAGLLKYTQSVCYHYKISY